MLRSLLLSSAAAIALSTGALAADLPSRAPPPVYVPPAPIFTWTGFYIGGQIGYGWGQNNVSFGDNFGDYDTFNYTTEGVIGGAHVGYNLQLNQFVIGLEGDVDGTSIGKNYSGPLPFGSNFVNGGLLSEPLAGNVNVSVHHDIEGSIRGRVGYAWDRVLIYATGGVAFGGFNGNISGNFPGGFFGPNATAFPAFGGSASASSTRVGWTVGGGIEYAVTNSWSIRAEYRYTAFGHSTVYADSFTAPILGASGAFFNRNFNENRIQVGFSYKFDTAAPAPVVAKY
ncbi:outer membrane protein [Methylocella sp.]|jgi:outer membrane immunogenic protein|uniref:outer membrane protein n=1 Tax=Methylocella sp. TaxID=1978226 RepID=UPI003C18EACD